MSRRNTPSQTAVFSLFEEGKALSPDAIENELGDRMNRSTIYRILNRFVEDGKLHRVVGGDGRQYFALCDGCVEEEHHHDHLHFRCLACKQVECLPQPLDLKLPGGYQQVEINATVAGYCAACNSI